MNTRQNILLRMVISVYTLITLHALPGLLMANPGMDGLLANSREVKGFYSISAITPFHGWAAGETPEQIRDRLRKELAKAKESGAIGVRVDFWWSMIEEKQGEFRWEVPDIIINEIVAAGLEPFPIFGYNSAWDPDHSPATPEAREEFGRFVSALVTRYRDRVTCWEAWNEPDTPPFWVPAAVPQDYRDLLEVIAREARKADPNVKIVGMGTAGPNYSFIESVYRAGAAPFFDILSYHHYSDEKTEAVLEYELRRIRDIMTRYGDEDKPIWITELGLTTGPSHVMGAMTLEDQAEWIFKKFLIAMSQDVGRIYYFKQQEDDPTKNPDGLWGLLDHTGEPKPSWDMWTQMTSLIGESVYLGSAARMSQNPNRRNGVEFHLFQHQDETFAVSWVRDDGPPLHIRVPADNVTVQDIYGNEMAAIAGDNGFAELEANSDPVYIRNLPARSTLLSSIRFEPEVLHIGPGLTKEVAVSAYNPTSEDVEIRFDPLFWPRKDNPVEVSGPGTSVVVPAGGEASTVYTFAMPVDSKLQEGDEFAFNDLSKYSYRLPVRFQTGAEMLMGAHIHGVRPLIFLNLTNRTEEELSGRILWEEEGVGVRQEEFEPLEPHETRLIQYRPATMPGEKCLRAALLEDGKEFAETVYRLYGMPITIRPMEMDGRLDDWQSIPFVELGAEDRSVFAGRVGLAWSQDYFFVAADIQDGTPLINSHSEGEIWRGDALELYLGFEGPTTDEIYGKGHFHLALAPAGEGLKAWNWQSKRADGGAPIVGLTGAVQKTSSGYTIEASIPVSEFDQQILGTRSIGLDIHLNNSNDPEADKPAEILIWNGNDLNYKNPSRWGIGTLLPENQFTGLPGDEKE